MAFALEAAVEGAALTGTVLPVNVDLAIGDDFGSLVLTAVDVSARSQP